VKNKKLLIAAGAVVLLAAVTYASWPYLPPVIAHRVEIMEKTLASQDVVAKIRFEGRDIVFDVTKPADPSIGEDLKMLSVLWIGFQRGWVNPGKDCVVVMKGGKVTKYLKWEDCYTWTKEAMVTTGEYSNMMVNRKLIMLWEYKHPYEARDKMDSLGLNSR
jgi:hypothetical protein